MARRRCASARKRSAAWWKRPTTAFPSRRRSAAGKRKSWAQPPQSTAASKAAFCTTPAHATSRSMPTSTAVAAAIISSRATLTSSPPTRRRPSTASSRTHPFTRKDKRWGARICSTAAMWAPRSPASPRSIIFRPWKARRRTGVSRSSRSSTPAKASSGRKRPRSTSSASGPARSIITMTSSASAISASTAYARRSTTTPRKPELKSSSCRWRRRSGHSSARSGHSSITSRSTPRAMPAACSARRAPIAAPPISSTSCGSPTRCARYWRGALKTFVSTARPAYFRRRSSRRRTIRPCRCKRLASRPPASVSRCSRTCRPGWSPAPQCNVSSGRPARSSSSPTARMTRAAPSTSATPR